MASGQARFSCGGGCQPRNSFALRMNPASLAVGPGVAAGCRLGGRLSPNPQIVRNPMRHFGFRRHPLDPEEFPSGPSPRNSSRKTESRKAVAREVFDIAAGR